MKIQNASTEMGTCECFKPAYISSCYGRYSYDVGSRYPSNVWKYFLQTKSYMKLIKSRWLKYNAIQTHLSQTVHGIFNACGWSYKTHCVQLIKDKTTLFLLKDK